VTPGSKAMQSILVLLSILQYAGFTLNVETQKGNLQMVNYSDIQTKVQIVGKLGLPLGQLVSVRGKWTHADPSKPASPVFVINHVNNNVVATQIIFPDVVPVQV